MPKLRNAATELEGLVQWIGRKFKNHQPTSELHVDPPSRQALASTYKTATIEKAQHEVWMDGTLRNAVLVKDRDRYFRIEVREIAEDDFNEPEHWEIGS